MALESLLLPSLWAFLVSLWLISSYHSSDILSSTKVSQLEVKLRMLQDGSTRR